MWELGLVVAAGFLGSSHCVGMCGPFALLLGARRGSWSRQLGRQLLYSIGRIFTYAWLGAAAGYGGAELFRRAPSIVRVPALLCIVAGLGLLYQGLVSAGVLRSPRFAAAVTSCWSGKLLGAFLRSGRGRDVFFAGVFTGMLPCGLVYALLGMAASQGELLHGALVMTAFGLGTVPAMVTLGSGAQLISPRNRQRLLRVAAACVVLTGILTIGRGVAFWQAGANVAEACPLCTDDVATGPSP